MKKALILVLSLAMTLSLFTACTQEAPPAEEAKTETEAAPEAAPASEAPKEAEAAPEAASEAPAAPEAPADKKYVFGRVIFDLSHPYQQADAKWFEKYCQEMGAEAIIMDGKSSAEVMTKCVEDLIAKKVDGIVIQPADAASGNGFVKMAQDAGIPIVTFVNNPPDVPAPHIELAEAATSKAMGALAATKWKEFYPDKPIKVGIIDLPSVQQVHEQRAMAFFEGVQSVASDAELVATLDGGGIRDKSFTAAQDLIQAHPEVNIIYGINCDAGMGALAAFEEAGRGKAVDGVPQTELFVSTDGTELEAVKIFDKTSALKLTMALSPRLFARAHLDLLMRVINGEIKMTDEEIVDVNDVIFDYWNTTPEEFEKFLVDDYFSQPGFAATVK